MSRNIWEKIGKFWEVIQKFSKTTLENLENYFGKFWESSNFKKIISENLEQYCGEFQELFS